MRETGGGKEQRGEKEQQKGKGFAGTTRRKAGDLRGGGTEGKYGTGDGGTGGGVLRKTRSEQAKRWKLGKSKRQPGSSTALNSFDPVHLARRSSRCIPVAGCVQSETETQREILRERETLRVRPACRQFVKRALRQRATRGH